MHKRLIQGVQFLVLGLGLISAGALIHTIDAAAAAGPGIVNNLRLHKGNAATYCATENLGGFAKGMVWISNNDNLYYNETVTIGSSDALIPVTIRGAVNTCSNAYSGSRKTYAVNVQSITPPAGVNRLSIGSSKTLFRGTVPAGKTYEWSSEPGPKGESAQGWLAATLDTRNVAQCTAGSGSVATGTIRVKIRRVMQLRDYNGVVTYTQEGSGDEDFYVSVRRNCPVPTNEWSITPSVSITSSSSQDSRPGGTITWTHVVRNVGPSSTNQTLLVRSQNSGYLGTGLSGVLRSVPSPFARNAAADTTSSYAVTQSDVGNSICRRTYVTPGSSASMNAARSSTACRTIPYSYNLTPSITASPEGVVEPGDDYSVRGRVVNSGPTKSYPTDVRYVRVINPSRTTTGTGSMAGACAYYGGDCRVEAGGQKNNTSFDSIGGGVITNVSYTQNTITGTVPDDLSAGDEVCFGLVVSGYNQSTGAGKTSARYSELTCAVVGKKPKVQVHGGSLQVGRATSGGTYNEGAGVETSISSVGSSVYGSWSEYGVFAPGQILNTASASGLAGENGGSSVQQSAWSRLSFTHVNRSVPCATIDYGCYEYGSLTTPRIAETFSGSISGSVGNSVTPRGIANSTGVGVRVVGNVATTMITINRGTPAQNVLQAGQSGVLYAPNAHVVIDTDIEYTDDSISNARSIPQLIIIARNITINSDVTRVDAWLIASNALSTCNERNGGANILSVRDKSNSSIRLTSNDCDKQLQVNGPVVAGRLFLRRTAGSEGDGASRGAPAEIFNLRPDAYLWARAYTGGQGAYQTTNLSELPPRY